MLNNNNALRLQLQLFHRPMCVSLCSLFPHYDRARVMRLYYVSRFLPFCFQCLYLSVASCQCRFFASFFLKLTSFSYFFALFLSLIAVFLHSYFLSGFYATRKNVLSSLTDDHRRLHKFWIKSFANTLVVCVLYYTYYAATKAAHFMNKKAKEQTTERLSKIKRNDEFRRLLTTGTNVIFIQPCKF